MSILMQRHWNCYLVLLLDHILNLQTVCGFPILKRIKTLLNVMRRANKCVPGLKLLEYENRLKLMKLPSMHYRRVRGDLIEVYKFMHGFYNCRNPLGLCDQGVARGHHFKLKKKLCKTSSRQHFFCNRVIDTWNKLDETVVNVSSMNALKSRVDNTLKAFVYQPSISHPLSSSVPTSSSVTQVSVSLA